MNSAANARAEACCLVTPPGHAILDTGCTSTLVGSENEKRWNEELKRLSGGSLNAERGPSETRFEGINGETKASYSVKYPVRIGKQDGFVQASVIPGKAPFLLSIQALRQMKAKLDCGSDTLEIPGIGVVHLETNQVGHYLLPLFQFGFHSAEAPEFPPEGECEDLTRPPGLDHGKPSLGSVVEGQGSHPPLHEPVQSDALQIPEFDSIAGRSETHARSVFLRLAKETHGPWVPLPRDLNAVYTILGPHAFDSHQRPWQVRAAQIGYRARVIRRPPAALSGHEVWTLVLSLSDRDRVLRTLVDWTPCHACSGKEIGSAEGDARMFMFVFAFKPEVPSKSVPAFPCMNMTARVPEGPKDLRTVFMLRDGRRVEYRNRRARSYQLPPKGSGILLSNLSRRYTYCAQHGDLLEEYTFEQPVSQGLSASSGNPVTQQALVANQCAVRDLIDQAISEPELSSCADSSEYFSCSECEDVSGSDRILSRKVRAPSGGRDEPTPGLLPLSRTPAGEIREQALHHLSLQFLQELSSLQGEDLPDQCPDQADHVLSLEGLQQDLCAGAASVPRWRSGARRWGSRPHRGPLAECAVSSQHPKGEHSRDAVLDSTSQDFGSTEWYRIHTPSSDEGEANNFCGDQQQWQRQWRCQAYGCRSAGCSCSRGADADNDHANNLASNINANDDPDDIASVHNISDDRTAVDNPRSHGSTSPRAGHSHDDTGGGGRGCSTGDGGRHLAHSSRAASSRNSDIGTEGDLGKNASRLRSRWSRWMGVCGIAMMAHLAQETLVPSSHALEASDPDAHQGDPSSTDWPRVSPEVDFLYAPDSLELPACWKATKVDFSRRATRPELKRWLGPQGWKLDRGVEVGLVEVYAGKGNLSHCFEEGGHGEAIRLGLAWGQQLRGKEARWCLKSLLETCKPPDVFVSFPCKAHCSWNRFNARRSLETRQKILRDRLLSRDDMDLLFEVIECQSLGKRHTHAENPRASSAWDDPRFNQLPMDHGFVHFDQCVLGLKHPAHGKPLKKPTLIFTTRKSLAQHMCQFRCSHSGCEHGRIEGTFQGRSISSWAEDYEPPLCNALIEGFGRLHNAFVAEGIDTDGDASSNVPHFDEQCEQGLTGSVLVEKRFALQGVVVEQAFAGESQQSQTVFKVTDPNLAQQLNKLQYPGRYKKDDLPIPIQTQLHSWSGLEVDTVVCARQLKCFATLPSGVVATKRTTLARVGGEWFYVDWCRDFSGLKRLRLPLNASLVVTMFGDKPQQEQPPAEVQPRPQPVPGLGPGNVSQSAVHSYLQRLHVGLGHCGAAEFLQHLRDAGAAPWLIRQAERFRCAVCDSQKPPPSHSVVGSAKPRSFNSILAIDTLDLTLQRDGVQFRVFLLTSVDTATSFARAFHLEAGDAKTAVAALEQGWFQAYGPPEVIYTDPDTIFRSESFAQFLTRNAVLERLSAAQSPWQHGQVERLHRTIRQQAQRVFESERTCSPYEAVTSVLQARNELMRVEGVSPAVLVFGKLPRAPPNMAESDEDFRCLAERLHNEDPLYEVVMQRRMAARTAWVQSEVRDRTARIQATRSRPYQGPYYKGQVVLVYRRRRGDATNPGRRGVWLGPGEVVAVESTSDKLVPRVVYVTVHGRLFLCSPEQLRPVSLKAEWVRTKLQEAGVSGQTTFQEMKLARGIDVRNERPSSAELEQEHETPEEQLVLEPLGSEADYEPLPQAPYTPAPGTPGPATPVPGTPVPSTPAPAPTTPRAARFELPSASVAPQPLPTPPGGDTADPSDVRRGEKRVHDSTLEDEATHRAQHGPTPVVSNVPATVTGVDPPRRGRSRTPPPREGSYWAFADFDGVGSDHANEAWYTESDDHDYSGLSLGLEFDVDLEEIRDEASIRYIVQEMAMSAAAMKKRSAEVSERYLSYEEKEMFRVAKQAEWSQWISNDVVELISRKGIDPRRVIGCRWVLTWKRVEDTPNSPKKAKARLVIRGFRDPDLGQFSTASPTLSRQGRHAVLTIAAQNMWRVFTLDAKTAFLAGEKSSRVKPIYAELPKDLIHEQGYDEDIIARIKKVPYGLSEAPLAWYRRLTSELETCGFQQVPADRCVYVLRSKKPGNRVLGVIGAHVDDLIIAGCTLNEDPEFEAALRKLTDRLPFGERKYADTMPVIYTGITLNQHPQTRAIVIDQTQYIQKLKEVPTRQLPEGLLDKKGQTTFWSQLGALLWVAINTRPDIAYDVSHHASFGTKPEKKHLVALNKLVRTLQSKEQTMTFSRVADSWDDMTLVVFADAGHTSRPSGHSQAGTFVFWASKEVLKGKEVKANIAEYSSSKIDRAVWSSYASELQAATLALDCAVSVLLLYEQILWGLKAKDVKAKLTNGTVARVLVTDNKGLFDAIQVEKPSTRQGVKMQSLVYQILYDFVTDYGFKTYWVNGEHMFADGLTKLSSSGGKCDLIRDLMGHSNIRITYCETSGRKERQLRALQPVRPASKDLESSIDV